MGYVDLNFAMARRLQVAELRNESGRFVVPGLPSLRAAVPDPTKGPDTDSDFRVPLDEGNPDAYPCASLAWIVIRPSLEDPARATVLHRFASWLVEETSRQQVERLLYPTSAAHSVGAHDDRRSPAKSPRVAVR